MLLCQVEMKALDNVAQEPTYYIVGRYGFDPDLQEQEEIWINWQVWDKKFEIKSKVVGRRKEIYVDGKSIVLEMNDTEREKFSAIYPDGIETLSNGASLLLLRIFVEAIDKNQLFEIQKALSQGKKMLKPQGQLPEMSVGKQN